MAGGSSLWDIQLAYCTIDEQMSRVWNEERSKAEEDPNEELVEPHPVV